MLIAYRNLYEVVNGFLLERKKTALLALNSLALPYT